MSETFKAIEFPSRQFSNKTEMHRELFKHSDKIIQLKKSQTFKSNEKGQPQVSMLDMSTEIIKGIDGATDGNIYPITSTTRYFDSHKDVHFDGCFGRTVKDQQGKVMYALDHNLQWDSILAFPKDVRMFVQSVDWSTVGKSYIGQTEALIFEISKDKIVRRDVLDAIINKIADFENSIRMEYVKIILGINTNEPSMIESKKYYEQRIGEIVNRDKVEESGDYFWGVEELKVRKECSLVVAGGSNDATSIYTKDIEPSNDTQDSEPPKGTQTNKVAVKNSDLNLFLNNL